ncbi:MAG: tetratricopeptide repeat protein [Armatimonadota bacterium]|nr:tetratricopeptide repeat protein [Armatimonadota bacterium]
MAKCPSCGRELSDDANFCDKCGASLGSSAISQIIDDAKKAISANPNDASARYNLAIAYKLGGMEDLALEELSRVAELQPDFVDVHYELGVLHAKSGRTEQAIGALSRAVELGPGHARAERLLRRLRERG